MADTKQARPRAANRSRNRSSARQAARAPASWSPFASGSTYDPDEDRYWLEREITLLERAVEDKGEMRRSELGNLVGCKYWGPGRFGRALRAAVDQGRIAHPGFGRYGPASSTSGRRG